jgi:viroplasmin and RNaseH domain-containing protein
MAIIFGSESEFLDVGAASYISCATLDSSKFIIAYRDGDDSNHGTAKIGTVSGTNITFDNEAEFLSIGAATHISIDVLNSSKFIVVYSDGNDSDHGTAKIGTVSGTTIAFGDETEFQWSLGGVNFNSVAALEPTKFIVAYQDQADSSHGIANIGTVSGTTITFGDRTVFNDTGATPYISVAMLDEFKFVVVYKDDFDSGHGTAKIGTVSGTTITFSDEKEFNSSGIVYYNSVAALDTTKFVVTYRDAADSDHGTAKIGMVSGTTITFGDETEFNSGLTNINSIAVLDTTKFVIAYNDSADSNKGKAKVGTVIGTNITFDDEVEFLSVDGVDDISTTTLSASKFIIGYRDTADSSHGTAKVGSIPIGLTEITTSGDLFIHGYTDYTASGDLFVYGLDNIEISGNLYIQSHEDIVVSGDLFIDGHIDVSGSAPSLFIRGIDAIAARPLDWLLKTSDHYPQIIGTLDGATSANIQLWEITDGQNTPVSVVSSGCYQIGNTGRWAWSTSGLPVYTTYQQQYFYMMTADNSETFTGQFFLEFPENAKWIYPRNLIEYLLN